MTWRYPEINVPGETAEGAHMMGEKRKSAQMSLVSWLLAWFVYVTVIALLQVIW